MISQVSQHRTTLFINVGDYSAAVLHLAYVDSSGANALTAALTVSNIDAELITLISEIQGTTAPLLSNAEKQYKWTANSSNVITSITLIDVVCLHWIHAVSGVTASSVRYFMALPDLSGTGIELMSSWVNQQGFHPKPMLPGGGGGGGVQSVTGDLVDNTDPVNPVILNPPALLKTVVNLSSASVLAMFAAPQTLILGIPNVVIIPYLVMAEFDYLGVAYTGGGNVQIIEETSAVALVPAYLSAADVNGTADFIKERLASASASFTRLAGKGLQINNLVGAFLTGTGTLKITIYHINQTI